MSEDLDVKDLQSLLDEYSKIAKAEDKVDGGPSLLEICSYPHHRFEEICSRIIRFFFNWNAEHGFKDLWIKSLFDCLKDQDEKINQDKVLTLGNIHINNEERTEENRRIDIVVVTEKWVLAIENKINAIVYNPLDIYKKHIENNYKGKKHYNVVLSLRDSSSDSKIKDNGFYYVSYKMLIDKVRNNIGSYIINGNQYYLNMMMDFIKTLENKMATELTNEQRNFFDENNEVLVKLFEKFKVYQQVTNKDRIDSINRIKEELNKEDGEWWIFDNFDLGHHFVREYFIGIESWYYGAGLNNYEIVITTWDKKNWEPNKKLVMNEFKEEEKWVLEKDLSSNSNRSYYRYKMENTTEDEIIKKLSDVCQRMKKLEFVTT